MRVSIIQAGVVASVAAAANAQIQYQVAGTITEAENLAFAVINGEVLASNPEPGDLPLDFTGLITIDTAGNVADFEFGGSFASPNRSYVFDVVTPNVIDGLQAITPSNVIITDTFDGFDFDLALNIAGETGTFNLFQPGFVPSVPVGDRSVSGFFTSVRVVPGAPTALALIGAGFLGLRRNDPDRSRA